MGKKLKMKNVRVKDCISAIDNISREPKKAMEAISENNSDPRSLRHLHNLADELEGSVRDYVEIRKEATEKMEEVRKPFQEELDAALKDCESEDEYSLREKEIRRRADIALREADDRFAKEMNLKEKHDEEVEVKIDSDERFSVLKKLLEKEGVNMFNESKALLEILDSIDAAEEL